MESALRLAALILLPFALPPGEQESADLLDQRPAGQGPASREDLPFERNLLGPVEDPDKVPNHRCNPTETECVPDVNYSCKITITIVEGELRFECIQEKYPDGPPPGSNL